MNKLTRFVGLSLSLVVLMTALFFCGTKVLENKFDTHQIFAQGYTELINLTALTQEMRRREKDFFLRKDIIYAKQYDNLYKEASAHIKDIQNLSSGKIFSTDLKQLDELLKEHHKQFVLAVRITQEIGVDLDKGLQGKMRDYIHNLEDILVYQIKDKQLTILLFTLRRNEKNFLLKMQSEPAQPTPEAAKEFQAYLKDLNIKPAVKTEALSYLDQYLDAFKKLVADELKLRETSASLTSIFTDFEHIHYKLLKQSRASAQETYIQAIGFLHKLQLTFFILSIAALLIVGIYGDRLRRKSGDR